MTIPEENKSLEQLQQENADLRARIVEFEEKEQQYLGTLSLSEERYRNLVEHMKEVIYVLDTAGKIRYLSPSIESFSGYTFQEIKGRNMLELIHPDHHVDIKRGFQSVVQGENRSNEYRIHTKAGEIRWILTSSHPYVENGRITGVQGILMDITGVKQMGERLHREARKNVLLAELSRKLIAEESKDTLSRIILEYASQLTGSSAGYTGLIDQETGIAGCPALLLNGTLVDDTEFSSNVLEKRKGLWGQVLEHRKPIICNHPGDADIPNDHFPIHRYLAVPALVGDTLIGQIAVANADRDYTTTDLSVMEQLANLFAITLHRRQSLQALAVSEEQYRTTINGIDDMIHVIDTHLDIELSNTSFINNIVKFSDCSPEILHNNLFKVCPFLSEFVRKEYEQVIQTGLPLLTQECTDVGKYNIWTDTHKIPLLDPQGKVHRIITIIRDITNFKDIEKSLTDLTEALEARVQERTRELAQKNEELQGEITEHQKTEIALRESELTSRALLNAPTESALLVALDGTIITLNETAAQRLEKEPADLKGMNVRDVFPESNLNTKMTHGMKVLETGKPVRYEDYRAGMCFDTTIYPVFDATGKIYRWAVYARDITRQKKMEDELLKTQKLESIGVLAGGIAHDFNNILTGVLGYINIARIQSKSNETVKVLLDKAERAALQTKDLTQQLLTFARGGAPVIKTTVINKLLRESADFAARGSGIQCRFRILSDLHPVDIDEGQIKQVINNLIINAVQAMPEGGSVVIRAENCVVDSPAAHWMQPGKYVQVSVTDSGSGIPPENLTKVFDPYFTTKPSGTGLGLAVSYSIINNHSGNITAVSEPGKGTTVTFLIPASENEYSPDPFGEEQLFQGSGKILIMDDEYIVRDVFQQMLIELGFEVVMSADGSEAVAAFRNARESKKPFDLVFLDLTVPGTMGGVNAIQKMRDLDPTIKAIVTSGYSNDDILANYSDHGFNDYIIKPFKISELSQVLRRVM